jgi:hypothetical protein
MSLRVPFLYRQVALLFLMVLWASCTRAAEELPVYPPLTYPLARDLIGYGVVSVSYTHITDTPERDGASLGYLRRGSLVKIKERRSINRNGVGETWVLVEPHPDGGGQGWLPEDSLAVYDREERAQTAAQNLAP